MFEYYFWGDKCIEWSTNDPHRTLTVNSTAYARPITLGLRLKADLRSDVSFISWNSSFPWWSLFKAIKWFIHKYIQIFSCVVTLGPCGNDVLCIKQEGSHTAGPSLAGPCRTEGELEIKVVSQKSDYLLNAKMRIFWHNVLSNGALKMLKITAAAFEVCLCCCTF